MKRYKPVTPSRRHAIKKDFSLLTKKKPEKGLVLMIKKKAGRSSNGRITVRHRGGGVKRLYRIVDFGEKKIGISANVVALEYDPNRTSFIALLEYEDNKKGYILAPQGLKKGDKVTVDKKTSVKVGNRMILKNIPLGTMVHNIELEPGKGGKLARGAGTGAKLITLENGLVHLSMPSSEIRCVREECFASIGTVSNPDHRFVVIGKAGKVRLKGRRPQVRGVAMNPVDHPHGGGEGRSPIGMKYPKTPQGKHALGVKTRKKKWTDKYIIKRRKKKKRK